MSKTISGNILIVDDQLPNLRILVNILEEENYKVRKATNGQSAIKAAKKEPPDLVLLDIKMPNMDGYEVCKKLKFDSKTKNIPVIFISALDEVFDKVKAFEVGGIDYIKKPFQQEEILARIKSQLTIKKQQFLLEKEQETLKIKQELLEQEQKKLKQEIEQRKKTEAILHQSQALISSILTTSLDGIAALEAVRNPKTSTIENFRFLIINPIILQLFDRKAEDLTSKLVFKELITKIDPNLFNAFVNVVEKGLSLENEFTHQFQEQTKWYNFIAVKLGDGFAITIRDITVRKELELESNRLATIDGLTGISNRRTFDQTLIEQWQSCQRQKQYLSLILCDIDYFKLYNDFYGHQKGDDCLKIVAQTINNVIKRPLDLVARYGGEEFVVILPNTNQEGAILIAQEIQQSVRLKAIPHQASKVSSTISLSLGIASLIPTPQTSFNILINLADQALYSAKQQGRDQFQSQSFLEVS